MRRLHPGLLERLQRIAEAFAPPYSTLQVGVIRGGTGINIVPAQCVFEVEARAIDLSRIVPPSEYPTSAPSVTQEARP